MKKITHEGVITKITNNEIEVTVKVTGACASCQLNKMCISTESAEKIIIVPKKDNDNYRLGEHVEISSTTRQGYVAVCLVYVLPVILLVTAYFISFSYFDNELLSASVSIGIIILYDILIYFLNPLIKNKISFKLKHINYN
jgi:positive regulator of sigma E activity